MKNDHCLYSGLLYVRYGQHYPDRIWCLWQCQHYNPLDVKSLSVHASVEEAVGAVELRNKLHHEKNDLCSTGNRLNLKDFHRVFLVFLLFSFFCIFLFSEWD